MTDPFAHIPVVVPGRIKFAIPCDPPKSLSKNSKQLRVLNGRPLMTDATKTKEAKSTILQLFQRHAPPAPITGPVSLTISFYYPFPASTSKRVVNAGDSPKVTRPDVDGIATGVMDVMTTLRFWGDDSQVAALFVSKHMSETPGIHVCVEPLL